ncbi:hypothetical protein EET67_13550 [Pseudaminobacter arsenicus]|uniref:Uncharacterized protein n=1 Tax=Borborobacter arsenicus TaxID=1851146 RepID=A0A432V4T5_9HYPH|nr:hypothetical protein [Pseudaminobacter arsenicus]RUM97176.1 hypothetical protein EET67_13550 [Pseudaminobacter arsenicus]
MAELGEHSGAFGGRRLGGRALVENLRDFPRTRFLLKKKPTKFAGLPDRIVRSRPFAWNAVLTGHEETGRDAQ